MVSDIRMRAGTALDRGTALDVAVVDYCLGDILAKKNWWDSQRILSVLKRFYSRTSESRGKLHKLHFRYR
jgi:hypothetical protein